MTAREILLAMAARLEKPGAWCQGDFARDKDGDEVLSTSERAVCWCLHGAYQIDGPPALVEAIAAWDVLRNLLGDPLEFNDAPGRTQAEVVAACRAAAERCP